MPTPTWWWERSEQSPWKRTAASWLICISPCLQSKPTGVTALGKTPPISSRRQQKFEQTLGTAISALQGGMELREPDAAITHPIELKPTAFSRAANDPAVLGHCTEILSTWCKQLEGLLTETESAVRQGEDAGLGSEQAWWRERMSQFNSVAERVKRRGSRVVLGVTAAARSKLYKRWRELDMRVSDAANEATDNVKYLNTLDKSLEAVYHGTPRQILGGLPALLNNIKMLHTISRYYAKAEHMTGFLQKVTLQMIRNCREAILSPGKLWDQDPSVLLLNLADAIRLSDAYQEQYRLTKEGVGPDAFNFDESAIFGRMELFGKRCQKLISLFTTIQQFSSLSQHTHMEGLQKMVRDFYSIVEDIKRRPYDLLDYGQNQFERDFLEFKVNIHDLELALQGFINESFRNVTSTENALNLLQQFEAILQRDTLKADLEAKYQVIFQSYAADLEAVQKLYEKNKMAPPLPRNMPKVAGSIMWARHLLRRIEVPIRRFASNRGMMASKEAKRIVRQYNRVAKVLIEFELQWQDAWLKSIDASLAGLNSFLLTRHPHTGELLVNFDKDVWTLMREAKVMQRLGIAVPESVSLLLLQESKYKHYYSQLSHALKEYSRVLGQIRPLVKPLLSPHLEDLENKIKPGAYVLTWMSMNIDGFLHLFHQDLVRLENLVKQVNDALDNRVDVNLAAVAGTLLVDLPGDRSFTYDEFVACQTKFVHKQSEMLAIRNQEVERAIDYAVDLVKTYPRDNPEVMLSERECSLFCRHHSRLMYQALLTATKTSLAAMRKRLGSRSGAGFLFVERPFFDVNVELCVPHVTMRPTLEEIQGAINATAKKVLAAGRNLKVWGGDPNAAPTYDCMIAQDKEIVKVVLLLAGSIEGTKHGIKEYVSTFEQYSFLWQRDLQTEYAAFMATHPSLEGFEAQLKKYMAIEQAAAQIAPVHNMGSLSLNTLPVKYSLKSEAASWKAQFAKNLHKQGVEDLKAFDAYMRDTTLKLNRKIEDLEDVRFVMAVLKEVREKEASLDSLINPIEDMYALLVKYEVRVPKEETDLVSDLRYSWKKLRKLASEVTDALSQMQAGFKRELIKEVALFVTDAKSFRSKWEESGPMVPGLDPMEAVDRLKKFQQMFEVRKRKWVNYSSGEELFGLPITLYEGLEQTEKEITMLERLYSLYVAVIMTIRGYGDFFWVDVVEQMEAMLEQVNGFQNQAKKLPKALREWPAFHDCKKTIDDFLEELPLFQALAHKAMRPRHWKEVMRITGKELNLAEDSFKLGHLLDCKLLKYREEVEDLCAAAVKEEQIENKLAALAQEWALQDLHFQDYKTRGPVILKSTETAELVEKLEESQMSLGSMASSRYSAPFFEEVNAWMVKLSLVSEQLEQWLMVQNMWMYMEAVFSGGDIVKQLPGEAKRFQQIDKNFLKVVTYAADTKNVVAVCHGSELLRSLLPHLLEMLELCQKSLSAYLETKRAEFPRFYFVSDPTLLEILSLGSDPPSVVPHFQSGLFDSLTNVTFDKVDKSKMTEMFSQQAERVELEHAVEAKGMVETWLQRAGGRNAGHREGQGETRPPQRAGDGP
eukprot:jgi/Botrbrau1/16684/Bobra.0317s0002.1